MPPGLLMPVVPIGRQFCDSLAPCGREVRPARRQDMAGIQEGRQQYAVDRDVDLRGVGGLAVRIGLGKRERAVVAGSKLYSAVCVRMRLPPAGTTLLPQRSKTWPPGSVTETSLTVIGELLLLMIRIPGPSILPGLSEVVPTKTVFGEPFHGFGKNGLGRTLSA